MSKRANGYERTVLHLDILQWSNTVFWTISHWRLAMISQPSYDNRGYKDTSPGSLHRAIASEKIGPQDMNLNWHHLPMASNTLRETQKRNFVGITRPPSIYPIENLSQLPQLPAWNWLEPAQDAYETKNIQKSCAATCYFRAFQPFSSTSKTIQSIISEGGQPTQRCTRQMGGETVWSDGSTSPTSDLLCQIYDAFQETAAVLNWLSGWWLTYPSEKWWSSSVGMMTFPTYGKTKAMFQSPPTSYTWPLTTYQLDVDVQDRRSWEWGFKMAIESLWTTGFKLLYPEASKVNRKHYK